MSSVRAETFDLKFEARVASFYHVTGDARQELLKALSEVLREQGKKHDYIVWRVQLLSEEKNT